MGENLGESHGVEITGKIMIVVVIFLFLVVVIAFVFHLYSRAFWWRFSDSPAHQSQTQSQSSGEDGSGLDSSVLKSLPVTVFQSEELEKEGLECAVCLSEAVEGEKMKHLPECNHWFHVDCIDMWLQSHSTCPLCRTPVVPSQPPSFPTNVLVWGDRAQTQITPSPSSSSPSLVIDIPSHIHRHNPTSHSSSSSLFIKTTHNPSNPRAENGSRE